MGSEKKLNGTFYYQGEPITTGDLELNIRGMRVNSHWDGRMDIDYEFDAYEKKYSKEQNKTIYKKEMLKRMGVDRVIVNDKAVVVFLTNGDKGVAVCDENDYFDPMVGFSVAYAIAVGTKGNKSQFKKNLKKVL